MQDTDFNSGQGGVVLLVSDDLKKKYGFQKKACRVLCLLLAVGLMVLCGPEAAPAQKKTQSSNQFQPLKVPQTDLSSNS
jgi:hypothetical protein